MSEEALKEGNWLEMLKKMNLTRVKFRLGWTRWGSVYMLASSRHIAVKYVLPLYYTREDIEQVFDITKGYAKALPLNVQSIDTFRGHLLMVFISTIILRLFQRTLAKPPYSLDDVMSVIRNQKSKVFDEFVISTEPTKKQNELYKLVGVKPELSITRQGR